MAQAHNSSSNIHVWQFYGAMAASVRKGGAAHSFKKASRLFVHFVVWLNCSKTISAAWHDGPTTAEQRVVRRACVAQAGRASVSLGAKSAAVGAPHHADRAADRFDLDRALHRLCRGQLHLCHLGLHRY